MMAEQLVGDGDGGVTPTLRPLREALVEIGAQLLRHPVVRAVADQLMAEAKLPRYRLWADQVLAHSARQVDIERLAATGIDQPLDTVAGEFLALD
jgi:hypothetical protein